ncbi:multiheme c-type cytochrome [Ferrimonas balearica]|uniref:multiheme c-type cytochrome n=1 Tax=Ferrimonas balearica TaxID=44012 RepID=UPI001C995B0A|nr:hypothetical protein [Ferrimonas balearica]MBY5991038.1 hypothetical protein [Ferrimonas balearica]
MIENNKNWKVLASALAVSALLAGCGSDGKDGSDGEDGKPGPIGVHIDQADSLNTQNLFAEYDADSNQLVVEFDLVNTNGAAIYGASQDNLTLKMGRMALESEAARDDVQPMTEPMFNREIWASYHHRNDTRGSASMCSSSYTPYNECAVEEIETGKYRFVVDHALPTSKEEGGAEFFFAYDESQVQGLMMRVQRTLSNGKTDYDGTHYATYYWEAGNVEAERPKAVVADQTCFGCHTAEDSKANQYESARDEHYTYRMSNAHYGTSTEVCSFCHVDYGLRTVTDGDDVIEYSHSIKGLVHAIHTGATHADRRGVAKFESTIAKDGANPAFFLKFNKEDGIYPQEASNCHACHVDYTTDAETLPENVTIHALDWFADQDQRSCQNCHGDYHYGTNEGGCVSCHSTDNGNTRGGAMRHFAGHDTESRERAYNAAKLIDVAYSNFALAEDVLSFNVALTQGETVVDAKYVTSNNLYVNAIDPAHPQGFLVYRPSVTRTWNADGTITATVTDAALAAAIENGASIAVTASIKACYSNKSSTLSELDSEGACGGVVSQNAGLTEYFNLDGSEGTARHSAASMENCQACHSDDMVVRSSDHYRNADLATCAQCHEAGDYNSMAVRVHGTFGKAHGREDVQQLLSSANCQACHNDNYTLTDARETPLRWNRRDDSWSSPQAGVCASCHVSDYYDLGGGANSAKAHIESMGGVVAGSYDEAALSGESCATCHNAENIQKNHKFN